MDDIENKGVKVGKILLSPLEQEDITQLIVDSFRCAAEDARELAELVHRKTNGVLMC